MPDYVYIDPSGNMVGNNYRDNLPAAIEYARKLAAEYQVSRVCVAQVVEYKVRANQCHLCFRYFSEEADDELWPTCPTCDTEPTCPHCGSEIEFNETIKWFICTKCRKEINYNV